MNGNESIEPLPLKMDARKSDSNPIDCIKMFSYQIIGSIDLFLLDSYQDTLNENLNHSKKRLLYISSQHVPFSVASTTPHTNSIKKSLTMGLTQVFCIPFIYQNKKILIRHFQATVSFLFIFVYHAYTNQMQNHALN